MLDSQEANDFLSKQLEEQRRKVEVSEAAALRYKETHNATSVDDRQNIVVQRLTELNAQVTRAEDRTARQGSGLQPAARRPAFRRPD